MIAFDGMTDIGLEREKQEDSIYQMTISKEHNIYLFIIADGAGLVDDRLNPAEIACTEIGQFVKRQYDRDEDYLLENAEYILEEALYAANRVLGTFHVVNEEKFPGFGCCVTACLLYDNKFTFSHSGNTRLNLISTNKKGEPVIRQLTVDHTAGYEDLIARRITEEEYLSGTDKLRLTSCLGIFADPVIQTSTLPFKTNQIILMTTDGVHYPLWQRVMMELTLRSDNTLSAVTSLIEAAKIQKYEDNMSVFAIFNQN